MSPWRDKPYSNSRILREMKIISDQRGIMDRYLAEKKRWDEHLERTRSFILESVRRGEPEILLVCGSGWLLDVPLEELSRLGHIREIWLADIYHPPRVRKIINRLGKCHLLTIDLTGGAVRGSWQMIRDYKKSRIRPDLSRIPVARPDTVARRDTVARSDAPANPGVPASWDMILSVNLLNQLDILLVDYIRRFARPGKEEIASLRERIQKNHVDWITATRSCLISDVVEINSDRKGREMQRQELIFTSLPPAVREEQWLWRFDESGSYHQGMQTHFLVRALEY